MNFKKIEKEIKKSLDNLEGIKLSNQLKAEAILKAIEPLLTEAEKTYTEKSPKYVN